VGASATIALAHYVDAPLAISRQDGFTWSVTFRRQERQGSPDWANEIQSRLAGYVHLPFGGFAFPVLAARVAAGAATGPVAGRFEVGGVSGGFAPYATGPVLGTRRTFPVRGYDPAEVLGHRAVAGTVELRVPLAVIGRSIGHLPVGVDRLSLTLFADAGDAWDSGGLPQPVRLASGGGELVGDLTVPYDFPVRARVGVAVPVREPPSGGGRTARAYVVLGTDF
jgi:outer membrane protein assembly factor BamA